jgi:hypothetical protein
VPGIREWRFLQAAVFLFTAIIGRSGISAMLTKILVLIRIDPRSGSSKFKHRRHKFRVQTGRGKLGVPFEGKGNLVSCENQGFGGMP